MSDTHNTALLLCFEEDRASAQRIATAAALDLSVMERHRFPDGELKLRLPPVLPTRVVILRSLDYPNEKLIELLLVARTARTLGAHHVTLVAPYLAYMRQDIAFQPGEVVSQRVVGSFLADLFDAVITVDPHLHRVAGAPGHRAQRCATAGRPHRRAPPAIVSTAAACRAGRRIRTVACTGGRKPRLRIRGVPQGPQR